MHCVYVIIKSSGIRNVFALAAFFWFDRTQINKSTIFNSRKTLFFFVNSARKVKLQNLWKNSRQNCHAISFFITLISVKRSGPSSALIFATSSNLQQKFWCLSLESPTEVAYHLKWIVGALASFVTHNTVAWSGVVFPPSVQSTATISSQPAMHTLAEMII